MHSVVSLVVVAMFAGIVLTGLAGALPGSQELTSLSWLGTVTTVAALIVGIGIYRVQRRDQDASHRELLDAFEAQDQLLNDLGQAMQSDASSAGIGDAGDADDALTPVQRAKVEEEYGDGSIAAAWKTGEGKGNRPRLVRLRDGRFVSVYSGGRTGGTYVHEIEAPRRSRT